VLQRTPHSNIGQPKLTKSEKPGASKTPANASHRISEPVAPTLADTGYQGSGPGIRVPQPRRRCDPDTGRCRRLSANQREVNTATPAFAGQVNEPTPN
jgi:hypothetical protein